MSIYTSAEDSADFELTEGPFPPNMPPISEPGRAPERRLGAVPAPQQPAAAAPAVSSHTSVPYQAAPPTGIYSVPEEAFKIRDLDTGKEYALDKVQPIPPPLPHDLLGARPPPSPTALGGSRGIGCGGRPLLTLPAPPHTPHAHSASGSPTWTPALCMSWKGMSHPPLPVGQQRRRRSARSRAA